MAITLANISPEHRLVFRLKSSVTLLSGKQRETERKAENDAPWNINNDTLTGVMNCSFYLTFQRRWPKRSSEREGEEDQKLFPRRARPTDKAASAGKLA